MNSVLFIKVFTEEVSQNYADCCERESVGFLLLAWSHTYLRQERTHYQTCKLSNDARSKTKAKEEKLAARQASSHSSHKSPRQQHYAPSPLRPPPSLPTHLAYLAQQHAGSMLSLAYLHKAYCYEDFDLSWCHCCMNPSNKIELAAKKVKNT